MAHDPDCYVLVFCDSVVKKVKHLFEIKKKQQKNNKKTVEF